MDVEKLIKEFKQLDELQEETWKKLVSLGDSVCLGRMSYECAKAFEARYLEYINISEQQKQQIMQILRSAKPDDIIRN